MLGRLRTLTDPSLPTLYAKEVPTGKEVTGASFFSGTDERNATDFQFSKANVTMGEGNCGGNMGLLHRSLYIFLDFVP